jgi:hypothetical protein
MSRLLLVLVACALVAASCGPGTSSPTSSATPTGAASPAGSASSGSLESPASPVEGIVVRVVASGLNDVQGFTIRMASGETVDFRMGQLINAAEFPPSHLSEHQATSEPVRVWFEIDTGERVAVRIDDAG